MQRFFGRDRRRKRLSPIAKSRQAALAANPMYQYALQEYAQTVAPASSNHDGRQQLRQPSSVQSSSPPPSSVHSSTVQPQQQQQQTQESTNMSQPQQGNLQPSSSSSAISQDNVPLDSIRHSMSAMSALSDDGLGGGGIGGGSSFRHRPVSPTAGSDYAASQGAHSSTPSSYYHWDYVMNNVEHDDDDPMIPDASYEEYYGDAYVGAPVKYVYPSGYQSMRPRGGPWKLSIGVCLIFTWLSVFIVGHCSDRAAQTFYSTEIDDDAIKRRWCGSRLLYLMWVISMTITGLTAAYCSVIGYIKVRDFAVANCRSQPSVSVGKSDYYIQIHDNHNNNPGASLQQPSSSSPNHHHNHRIIYQADGTPRFWGAHIYRPTQAAVAVTSR